MTSPGVPLAERLLAKIEVDSRTGCWNRRDGRGCDRLGYWKLHVRPGLVERAHRVSWELANGAVPAGMFVCHRCDNPRCVNPAHLFLGTPADNVRDMDAKGRSRRRGLAGERNPNAKLTDQQVAEVRRRFAAGESKRAIARTFAISPALVYVIVVRGHRGKPRLVRAGAA